ncbi:CcmD family protein [Segetibacter sp.]|jgi:hypothetical protein|uniref:CcmD family protein n=1 Tax=Segetibacter sp. TaxID=2231182 RepID=UPI002624371A|nr:hypothetical protein [Segetibacter sp.]MCW3080088.1 hypothetical protein [Segetibacter sp.]
MAKYKKLVFIALALFVQLVAIAQTTGEATVTKDDGLMRSEGKIYVVMAVVITLLAGLLAYVIRLDKKITRLEKGDV